MGERPAGHQPPTEHQPPAGSGPLAREVEEALARLPGAPLAEHPRVYEALDARIRQELAAGQTGQEPAAGDERETEPPA